MKHLSIQELTILRQLQHGFSKMLQIEDKYVKFLDFHYVPGRRRDTKRPNWQFGEHYLMAGKNIDGIIFDIFEDEWLFFFKPGDQREKMYLKLRADYLNRQMKEDFL